MDSQPVPPAARLTPSDRHSPRLGLTLGVAVLLLVSCSTGVLAQSNIGDITGRYHFLGPDDTLAILEEEGKLKGFVDVFQGEDESDAILSYPLEIGMRKGDHVEFKTGKIHERYYRFTGAIERGPGRTVNDSDYMRLTGELETIIINSVTGKEDNQRQHVVFKLKGKAEMKQD